MKIEKICKKNGTSLNNKGITLLALVITIIVLIILAGVSINLLLGENGIIQKAQEAKTETEIAQIKEKVEMGLAELEAEYLDKEKLTIETALKELKNKKIFDSIEEQEGIGYIGDYEVKLKYNSNNSIEIEYVEIATGFRIRYTLSPEGYTNGNVTLTINLIGDVKIEGPEDSKSISKIDDKTYTIKENGEYEFKIKYSEGKIETKTISINTIDRNAPGKPEIEIKENTIQRDKFTIEVVNEVKDNESGVKEYGYFVAKKGETQYKEYKSSEKKYTVEGLEKGTTYTIYVVTYDNASNQSEKSTVLEATTIDNILKYPILTKDGIVNCVDDNGKYYLDTTVETKAKDSLLLASYDKNNDTYSRYTNNGETIVYLEVDKSAWGLYFNNIINTAETPSFGTPTLKFSFIDSEGKVLNESVYKGQTDKYVYTEYIYSNTKRIKITFTCGKGWGGTTYAKLYEITTPYVVVKPPQSIDNVNIKQGLVSYWPLKNNLYNAMTDNILEDLIVGENGKNIAFEDESVVLTGDIGLKLNDPEYSFPDEFTVSIDVKNIKQNGLLFGYYTSTPQESDNINGLDVSQDSVRIWNGTYGTFRYNYSFSNDRWYRIVMTGDSTECSVYVDGVKIGRKEQFIKKIGVFSIGYDYPKNSFSRPLKAQIRNCAIYDRVLTEEEISNLSF